MQAASKTSGHARMHKQVWGHKPPGPVCTACSHETLPVVVDWLGRPTPKIAASQPRHGEQRQQHESIEVNIWWCFMWYQGTAILQL